MSLSSGGKRILAIDVGVGTQDILVYEEGRIPDNNIKMVLPSQTQVLAKKVREGSGDIFLYGETMGGGPFSRAILERIAKGDRVSATPRAAMTIRDDPEEVKEEGIEIVQASCDTNCQRIETQDVDFNLIKDVLKNVEEEFAFDAIGIAVQDHGHEKGKSDRVFRFEKIKETLKRGATLADFMYEEPPEVYARMNGALRTIQEVHAGSACVVDTKIAAVAGAVFDIKERPVLCVDVGNGHTMAAIVGKGDAVLGLFEHHTNILEAEMFDRLLEKFIKGDLANEEIFEGGGHGCYVGEGVDINRILVTGPKRALLKDSKFKIEYANPFGDVMMAGPAGIVSMILRHR
ncbi:DUF1786 domain-containing protein [archaeon]|nr:DUF1786 domain-containing protein [archaeon]